MLDFLNTLADWLGAGRYSAHSLCLTNDPLVMAIFLFGDVITGTSYFIMGLSLMIYQARIVRLSPTAFWMFGAFIFLCGAEHFAKSLTLFVGVYRLEAFVTAAMAAVSAVTAMLTIQQIPGWARRRESE